MCDAVCKMDGKWGCQCLNQAMNHMLFRLICPRPDSSLRFVTHFFLSFLFPEYGQALVMFDSRKTDLKIKLCSLSHIILNQQYKYILLAGWEVRKFKTVTEVFSAKGSIFKARIAVFHPTEREIYCSFFPLSTLSRVCCLRFPKEFYKHKFVIIVLDSVSKYRLS